MAHQSVNPFDGKTQITCDGLDLRQLEGAIELSSRSFEASMRRSYVSRAAIVSSAGSRVNLQIRESQIEVAPLGAELSIYPHDQLTRFSAPNLMVDDEVTVEEARCGVQQCALPFEKLTMLAGASVGASTALPRSDESALSKVLDQVKRAVVDVETLVEDATLVLGGHRRDRPGAFMRPSILTEVNPGDLPFQTELFGPVMLVGVKRGAHPVALASDSELGLEGWVLTDGVGRSEPVVDRGDNGTVLVNQVIWTPRPRLFGSITTAVHGPELSSTGIEEAGSSVRIGALHDHA